MQSTSILSFGGCFVVGREYLNRRGGTPGSRSIAGIQPTAGTHLRPDQPWRGDAAHGPQPAARVRPGHKLRTCLRFGFVEGANPKGNKAAPTQHVSL